MKKIILIPAYKPSHRMTDLVMELKKRSFDVIVVDDGSGRKYEEYFEYADLYAKLIRHKRNKGKGEALKTGLRYIKERYEAPYIIVTADCDGQHRIDDIVKVSEVGEQHPDSLVLGKRELDKTAPFLSRLGNGTTRFYYRVCTGRRIHETQTGLRAFSDRLTDKYIDLPGKRYEYEMDMMLISSDDDIIEVPIETIYFDNNSDSHFDPFKDTLTLWIQYVRYKLPSILTAVVDYALFALAVALTGTFLIPNLIIRTATFILKFVLNKTIKFSEKASFVRYLITSLTIIALDTAALWGLTAIGVNVYPAKLISGILMIGVSIGMRMIFMRSMDENKPQ